MKIKDFEVYINKIAPTYLKEDFDNVGLMVGDSEDEISKILVALDGTIEVIEEAVEKKCDLIFTHHPLIFSKPSAITSKTIQGIKIRNLIKNNIALYSAHTNLDSVNGGITDTLGRMLELENLTVLSNNPHSCDAGIGRIGVTSGDITLKDILDRIKEKFGIENIRYCGELTNKIKRVALLNGSGQDFFKYAKEQSCDLIITGDTTYHYISDYNEEKINIIDMEHFYSEWIPLTEIAKNIKKDLEKYGVNVLLSEKSKSPYKNY